MRVGIVALLQESNTFVAAHTTLLDFERDLLLVGDAVRQQLADAHHEVGGFFSGLAQVGIEAVPVFAARAFPSGPMTTDTLGALIARMDMALDRVGKLDGILAAPHGATVAEGQPDVDGFWLGRLRARYGPRVPIVATLDPHANLSPRMVAACDALIAYRTNPHIDQRLRGEEAAHLLARTLGGEIRPVMAASYLPMAVNIECQATYEPPSLPLIEFADHQFARPGLLSNSVVFGFPYADVPEMGASVIAVTDGDPDLAQDCAEELADFWWDRRGEFVGELLPVTEALDRAEILEGPICLLDMGDNVGGGSPADGTNLARALHERGFGPAVAVIHDPNAVAAALEAGPGSRLELSVGEPVFSADFRVRGFCDGKFREPEPRHGGFTCFDQGTTAVVESDHGLTLVLTSKRTAPYSLGQLTCCGLEPGKFRVLVAKGVHSPVAAYRPVCRHMIRVDTPGVTAADLGRFDYRNRREPMFPFEATVTREAVHLRTR